MDVFSRSVLVTALTLGAWLALVRSGGPELTRSSDCAVTYVYDGDTVALDCGAEVEITARIVGLDAPETRNAGCAQELAHGALATDRLRALLTLGEVSLRKMGQDKYDRRLIRLYVDGEEVAQRLIREGLAVPYDGGRRIDWCARLGGTR